MKLKRKVIEVSVRKGSDAFGKLNFNFTVTLFISPERNGKSFPSYFSCSRAILYFEFFNSPHPQPS